MHFPSEQRVQSMYGCPLHVAYVLGLRSNWDSALKILVRPAVASNLKWLCNCVAKVATLDCLASTFVAVCGFRTIPGVCDAFRSTVGCCGLKWLLLKIGAAV